MPISGWGSCFILAVCAGVIGFLIYLGTNSKSVSIAVSILLIIIIFAVGFWYYNNTASGIRAKVDEYTNLTNGLSRTITIYTADGTVLKQYEGKIDIEQDQGYVKFDWNGKRYIYYNCYIETIADLP